MSKVKIPFLYRFKEPLLTGDKTCTSRTKKFGTSGDIFDAFGAKFQINKVWGTSLGIVEKTLWKREGVSSPEEFREVWMQIHARRGFKEGDLVYVHEFSQIDPEHPYPFRPCRTCRKPYIPTISEYQQDCIDCVEASTPHDEGDEELF